MSEDRSSEPVHPDIEAKIAKNPRGASAYLELGAQLKDWGSPRAELISLQHTLSQNPDDVALEARIDAHIQQHRTFYLGAFDWSAAPFGRRHDPLVWRLGFVSEVHVSFDPDPESHRSITRGAQALSELLDRRSGRLLQKLRVGIVCEDPAFATLPFQPVVDVIGAHKRPALRSLTLYARNAGPFELADEDDEPFTGQLGELGALWGALPRLEHLHLSAYPLRLGHLALSNLRSAHFSGDVAEDPECLLALAQAEWPRLERLALDLTCIARPKATPEDIMRIVDPTRAPKLKAFALFGFDADAILERLIASGPLISQLETLVLVGYSLTHVGAEILVKNRALLHRLKRLRIDHPYEGSDRLRAELRTLCPDVAFFPRRPVCDPQDTYAELGDLWCNWFRRLSSAQ